MTRLTRRSMLKRTGLAAGVAATAHLARGPILLAAEDRRKRLGVAVVGCGGMGGYSVDQACRERPVAMVEVDDGRIAKIMKEKVKPKLADGLPEPKVYHDYRKMLQECHKDIDVVLVATPDHNHAPAAIRAIHLGKHTFSQKPLCHNIREAYVLANAARDKKVHTQMGNQRHCGEGYRRVCEYIGAGAIGQVTETHTILGRNFGGSGGRPKSKPVPEGLHWNEWLGPAPYRDYHDGLHPFSWRSWRQFGTATVGDMACHHIDAPFWALRLDLAKTFTVECLATKNGSEEMYQQDNIVRWEVPARGNFGPVTVTSYDHQGLKPEIMKETEKQYERKFGEFTLFVGEKGLMGSDSRIIPEEKHKAFPAPEKTMPRAHGGPIEDLFHAVKHDGTPCSNFVDAAGPLTAFILTALLAQSAGVGKKLVWDVAKMQCTNVRAINRLVRRTYRKGWEV